MDRCKLNIHIKILFYLIVKGKNHAKEQSRLAKEQRSKAAKIEANFKPHFVGLKLASISFLNPLRDFNHQQIFRYITRMQR